MWQTFVRNPQAQVHPHFISTANRIIYTMCHWGTPRETLVGHANQKIGQKTVAEYGLAVDDDPKVTSSISSLIFKGPFLSTPFRKREKPASLNSTRHEDLK